MPPEISQFFKDIIGVGASQRQRVFASLLVIFAIWILRRVILRLVQETYQDVRVRYQWRKTSTYVSATLSILILGRIWIGGSESLSTYFGLLSAGLAIALQTPIVNFFGWLFLIWRRPIAVGDRIEIGGAKGDVVDIRIFMFTIMEVGNWVDADQSTGRIIHVPNGKIFTELVANYSKGFRYIWDEMPILITFESNWKKAKTILKKIAHKHDLSEEAVEQVQQAAERYLIFYQKLTPIVYTSVKESGVLLTIRYLSAPRQRRTVQEQIWEAILDSFAAETDIDFAYPTTRRYNNTTEGKPGAGGPTAPLSGPLT